MRIERTEFQLCPHCKYRMMTVYKFVNNAERVTDMKSYCYRCECETSWTAPTKHDPDLIPC